MRNLLVFAFYVGRVAFYIGRIADLGAVGHADSFTVAIGEINLIAMVIETIYLKKVGINRTLM
ncbi:MAG TPA: hypothetical protein PK228_01980 [Saprospiraceae bacterium]|nr:hypothetical protein [Saprospiraceae bacterium]